MDLAIAYEIQNKIRERLFNKFGKEPIFDKYNSDFVDFNEHYYNNETVYQVVVIDRRNGYTMDRNFFAFIDKDKHDMMVNKLNEYNDEVRKIYNEYEMSYKNNKNMDIWHILCSYLTEDYLGYLFDLYERNKIQEYEEE